MFDLSQNTALVTGASGGIGKAIAKALHQAGAKLVIAGRRKEVLESLQQELGEGVYVAVSDLSKPNGVDELLDKALHQVETIDILINNAGITKDNLAVRIKDEDWENVLALNLTSCFKLTRACLKTMMKARYGRIINIASIIGAIGSAGQSNYAAAKAGLVGMTKSIAQEVASRGVTINCIAPGFIETPMTDGLSPARKEELLKAIPQGRLGQGDDVAYACVYLASQESSYMTGQTLHINGGMVML